MIKFWMEQMKNEKGKVLVMKANIAVHLNKEDKVNNIEEVGVNQYRVVFESGYSLIIDNEILEAIWIRVPHKIDR